MKLIEHPQQHIEDIVTQWFFEINFLGWDILDLYGSNFEKKNTIKSIFELPQLQKILTYQQNLDPKQRYRTCSLRAAQPHHQPPLGNIYYYNFDIPHVI